MLHPDFKDLLAVFAKHSVDYLLIGGYAVGFHAEPRFTKDLDLWLRPEQDNIERACEALEEFGAPARTVDDLRHAQPNEIVWMGNPPVRIDMMKAPPGGDFPEMFSRHVRTIWDKVPVSVIARDDLMTLKHAAGRKQDMLDIEALERTRT
jgi:hypothetical protein